MTNSFVFPRSLFTWVIRDHPMIRHIQTLQHFGMDGDNLSLEVLEAGLETSGKMTGIRSSSAPPNGTLEKSIRGTPRVSLRLATPHDQFEAQCQATNGDTPVNQRNLRKRKINVQTSTTFGPDQEAIKPLTDEERRNWTGWVEHESDPVCSQASAHISTF